MYVLATVGCLFLIVLYGWVIEPRWLAVRRVTIPVDPVKLRDRQGRTQPVRFLFFSDIQVNRFTQMSGISHHLERLGRLRAREPFAFVLFGGDGVDVGTRYTDVLVAYFRQVSSWGVPFLGVLGNHDHSGGKGALTEVLAAYEAGGMQLLRNATATVPVGNGRTLQVVGLDDLHLAPGYTATVPATPAGYRNRAKAIPWLREIAGLSDTTLSILLTHNPDGIYLPRPRETVNDHQWQPDLVLAGHTHGGQTCLLDWLVQLRPFWRLVNNYLPEGSFLTWAGQRITEGTRLLVSRGIGGALVPLRLARRPEAHIITFVPAVIPEGLIIGISGKARSGKSTVARLLATHFPGIRQVAFGSAIKAEYDRLYGTHTLTDEAAKEQHRVGLNELGAARRAEDPDYWVKQALAVEPPAIFTDVRLPQEYTALRERGGVLIRVEAEPAVLAARSRVPVESYAANPTEIALDAETGWDFVISGNGSYAKLERQVERVAREVRKRL